MNLPDRAWRNLPVETASGTSIGKLVGVELDSETHRVTFYHVRRKGGLVSSGPELLISPTQVVLLTNEKMVVEDLLATDSESAQRKPNLVPASPALPSTRS
jgi:hypothetical protein